MRRTCKATSRARCTSRSKTSSATTRITGRGRHPLPSGRSVEAAARRWGVRQGVPTVVYDDWNRAGSARAWWVLTAAGHRRRAHPRRRPGRVAVSRRQPGHRPGHAATGRCDRAARRPLQRSAADPDRAASRRLRRCSTRAHPNASAVTSSRSIVLPDTSPARKTCPAALCSPATAPFWRPTHWPYCSRSAASTTAADWRVLRLRRHGRHYGRGARRDGLPGSAVSRLVVAMEFRSRQPSCPRRRLVRFHGMRFVTRRRRQCA